MSKGSWIRPFDRKKRDAGWDYWQRKRTCSERVESKEKADGQKTETKKAGTAGQR